MKKYIKIGILVLIALIFIGTPQIRNRPHKMTQRSKR